MRHLRFAGGPTVGGPGLVVAPGREDFFGPGDDPANSGGRVRVSWLLQAAGPVLTVATG